MQQRMNWLGNAAGWIALAATTLSHAQPAKPNAAFRQREFVVRNATDNLGASTTGVKAAFEPLDFGRSLLVADCGSNFAVEPSTSWCHSSEFQFEAVLARAAIATGNDARQLSADWWREASRNVVALRKDDIADQKPFHLLAAVNRLDLAGPDGSGMWGNGEVRFVYGVKDTFDENNTELTVIVEFVLNPMRWETFHSLNGAWRGLSTVALNDAAFRGRLSDVIEECLRGGVLKVRFRMNDGTADGPWTMREWVLHTRSALSREYLEHEIDSS